MNIYPVVFGALVVGLGGAFIVLCALLMREYAGKLPRRKTVSPRKPISGWWLCANRAELPHGHAYKNPHDSGKQVAPGVVFSILGGHVTLCRRGLHASRRLRDALSYHIGPYLCRVELWGEVEEQKHANNAGSPKLAAQYRKVIYIVDIQKDSRFLNVHSLNEIDALEAIYDKEHGYDPVTSRYAARV